jgi:hypothetical protein
MRTIDHKRERRIPFERHDEKVYDSTDERWEPPLVFASQLKPPPRTVAWDGNSHRIPLMMLVQALQPYKPPWPIGLATDAGSVSVVTDDA